MKRAAIIGAVIGALLGVAHHDAKAHVEGCHTTACDRRIHEKRAIQWCKRHESCLWRHRFARRPDNWRNWAWSTARCESGLRFHIATGNGFYGGLQFTPSTAWAAGFRRLPHLTTKWEQLTRAIDFARRHGTQHWPVCGR